MPFGINIPQGIPTGFWITLGVLAALLLREDKGASTNG